MLRGTFSFAIFAVLILAPLRASAQDDRVCRLRRIVVNVMEENQRYVTNLQAGDFRGQIRDQPVKIRSVTKPKASRHIVLLVDTSGSMSGQRPYQDRSEAALLLASEIVHRVPPTDHVRVAFFSDSVKAVVDFPALDRVGIQSRLRQAASTAKGKTAIFDSILSVLDDKDLPKDDLIELVLLTDAGGDNRSKRSLSEATRAMMLKNARFYPVLMRQDSFASTPEERDAPGLMSQLAQDTGGAALWFNDFEG